MSYRDIRVVKQYAVHCQDCSFKTTVASPGAAETAAQEHIEDFVEENGFPNHSHGVRVDEFTMIGRNV